MNLLVLFVVLLQVLTALCQSCRTNHGEMGTCMSSNDCHYSLPRPLTRCKRAGLFCCPPAPSAFAPKALAPVESQFPTDCGHTPMHPHGTIVNGYNVKPDEYSWLASLQYGHGNSFGFCGGSVIHSRYVLTSAHCVTGNRVNAVMHGLTGVRLGNFSQIPYCDYGSPGCNSFLHFGIEDIIVHENYSANTKQGLDNDIALIRLDKSISFDAVMKPVCLPLRNTRELQNNMILTVAGWGDSKVMNQIPEKRAVNVPLVTNQTICEFRDESRLCAGTTSRNLSEIKTTCDGDSGGPLMQQDRKQHMVIEGIVSTMRGDCLSEYFATQYTCVRHYLSWIQDNVCTGQNCPPSTRNRERTSIEERKFPSDCGYTPLYSSAQVDGIVAPDEYSWLASLQYGNQDSFGLCSGSVINSRYVLTSARCVTGEKIRQHGQLTAVRVGNLDEERLLDWCDYGTENCLIYLEYGIAKIIPHEGFNDVNLFVHDIALIRVNRPIEFGRRMKPICLPFGSNRIQEPTESTLLTIAGWGTSVGENNSLAKRDAAITLLSSKRCYLSPEHGQHLCAIGSGMSTGSGDFGGPLMHQYQSGQMVLEGVSTHYIGNCTRASFFPRVRSYGDWLNQNMVI